MSNGSRLTPISERLRFVSGSYTPVSLTIRKTIVMMVEIASKYITTEGKLLAYSLVAVSLSTFINSTIALLLIETDLVGSSGLAALLRAFVRPLA